MKGDTNSHTDCRPAGRPHWVRWWCRLSSLWRSGSRQNIWHRTKRRPVDRKWSRIEPGRRRRKWCHWVCSQCCTESKESAHQCSSRKRYRRQCSSSQKRRWHWGRDWGNRKSTRKCCCCKSNKWKHSLDYKSHKRG